MKLTKLTVNDAAIVSLVNNPYHGVIDVMDEVAGKLVSAVQMNLNEPWYQGIGTNPPPGPPRRRTGALLESIHFSGPLLGEDGLIQLVVGTDVHNLKGSNYGRELLNAGYKFVPKGLLPE